MNEKDETDSGLVEDYTDDEELTLIAFDVLPDENTLSFDYKELDLDLSEENFGPCEITPPISAKKELLPPIASKQEIIPDKCTSFTKEQARQWRRKRILNAQPSTKPQLLQLPDKLKPRTEKLTSLEKLRDPLLGGEKVGSNRAPLPLKLRALPQSFWKEPQENTLAGSHYSVLPPLFSGDNSHVVENVRPVTPPDEKCRSPRSSPRHKKKWVCGQPNTKLLFSLFDHLENKIDEKLIVKRGRPKKQMSEKTTRLPPHNEEDPCIVEALATKLFPELSLQQAKDKRDQLAAVIRIGKGSATVECPAIDQNQNYSAMLTELVTHM